MANASVNVAADATNIFQLKVPSGPLAASAAIQDPQKGGHPLKTLSEAVGTSLIGMVDSIDISAAGRVASELAAKTAELTASDGSPATVRAVHPVVDGNAELARGNGIINALGR